MNYIDKENTNISSIYINTKKDISTIDTTWTVTKEGDESVTYNFTTPSLDFNAYKRNYYTKIEGNWFNFDFINETSYSIKGVSNNEVVYRGKLFITNKDIQTYSVNENKYTQTQTSNDYTILE